MSGEENKDRSDNKMKRKLQKGVGKNLKVKELELRKNVKIRF